MYGKASARNQQPMKEEKKKYSVSDFARYHSGMMPADEMHALEKAALDDPFLADALEGYPYSVDAEKESADIKRRLKKSIKKQKGWNLFSLNDNKWLRIAALFILIGGASILFITINTHRKDSLVVNHEVNQEDSAAIVSKLKTDTAEKIVALEKTLSDNNNQIHERPSASSIKKSPAKTKSFTREKSTTQEEDAQETQKSIAEKNVVALNGVKINSPDPAPRDPEVQSFVDSDQSKLFSSKKFYSDSLISSVAIHDNKSLNQEVVMSKFRNKNAAAKFDSPHLLRGKVSGVSLEKNVAIPAGGMEVFNQYVKDSARSITDSAGRKLTGNILLGFTINAKGRAAEIKILRSDCKPCEEEAIRLLKQGPVWVGARERKASVWISL